jgi:HEAT repeat protein
MNVQVSSRQENTPESVRASRREVVCAALALLLGPSTEYQARTRATRRLAKQGPEQLPLILTALSQHPEITQPEWPGWPPQYEHCSRLLIQLSQQTRLSLTALLHHPELHTSPGPVLWTSIVEATSLVPYHNYEALLRLALETPWESTRYSAAISLSTRARRVTLQDASIETLCRHVGAEEALPVRLTAAYALLCCRHSVGLETLCSFLDPQEDEEARKAAVFMLSTELPFQLNELQRERLALALGRLLRDGNPDITLHAAHALSKIASPSLITQLNQMLKEPDAQTQVAVLICIEEIARRQSLRESIQRLELPGQILPLLRSELPDLRRQACYTLAACGGEYALAALGTVISRPEHPAHLEAIESLRVLNGVMQTPVRSKVLSWLHQLLNMPAEMTQVTALDSLAYLLWQASLRGQKRTWHEMGSEIISENMPGALLYHQSAWVRQRTVELIRLLGKRIEEVQDVCTRLLHLLCYDEDSGVRACIAYTLGQSGTRWAISALLRTLNDPDPHVVLTALNALEVTATPDDTVVIHALMELQHLPLTKNATELQIKQKVEMLLKKWRRSLSDQER